MSEPKGQEPKDAGLEPEEEKEQIDAGQGPEKEPQTFDADYVRRLRAEAAEYRKKLRELEQVVKQHEESKLSEAERMQKRLAELEKERDALKQQSQELALKHEVLFTASRLGIVDPDAAYKLLDKSKLEFDDDGQVRHLEQALKELIKAKPYLLGQGQVAHLSPTNPASNQQKAGTFTTSQLTDYRFWQQHRDEIMQAMREGRIVEG